MIETSINLTKPMSNRNLLTAMFTHFLTVVFILLFLYSGFGKILQYDPYLNYIQALSFQFKIITWFAYAVPFLEISVGLLILIPRFRRFGLSIGVLHFAIMISFWVYILWSGESTRLTLSFTGLMVNLSVGEHIFQNVLLLLMIAWNLKLINSRHRQL